MEAELPQPGQAPAVPVVGLKDTSKAAGAPALPWHSPGLPLELLLGQICKQPAPQEQCGAGDAGPAACPGMTWPWEIFEARAGGAESGTCCWPLAVLGESSS